MTDYLEEHLGSAEVLLRRIQQMEKSVSGLSLRSNSGEFVQNSANYPKKYRDNDEKSGIVPEKEDAVYNAENIVNKSEILVDKWGVDPEICEKGPDTVVNHKTKKDNDTPVQEGPETAFEGEEIEAQSNAKRAENRSALSAQLEELDRTVSAMTALSLEGRENTQSSWSSVRRANGYPISRPGPQAPVAGFNIDSVPGGAGSGLSASARADFSYGGTQSWAEQTDRAFRRDSRRYDGGFYLY